VALGAGTLLGVPELAMVRRAVGRRLRR
jgi:hypothetical protein